MAGRCSEEESTPLGGAEAAPKIVGEWIFSASIFHFTDVIFGRLCFIENGEVVYLSSGEELLGRGVGRWVAAGGVAVGFELELFQYAATSKDHVQGEPQRFRGIGKLPQDGGRFSGEWFSVAFQAAPRVVGIFKACRSAADFAASAQERKAPECPASAKKLLVEKLDKIAETPPMMEPRWAKHLVSGLPTIQYVRNWFEPRQVQDFLQTIERNCDWEHMMTRDTQEFGSSGRCACGRGLLREPLPNWLGNVGKALHALGVFHPVLFPVNSVRLNAYSPGLGIHPHMDGPVYFPRAAILSLGGHCIFDFYPRLAIDDKLGDFSWDRDNEVPSHPELPPGTKPLLSLLLEPGSLLVFSGEAFKNHRHGIRALDKDVIHDKVRNAKDLGLTVGDELPRKRRVSLTIRHLLPRCNCSRLAR